MSFKTGHKITQIYKDFLLEVFIIPDSKSPYCVITKPDGVVVFEKFKTTYGNAMLAMKNIIDKKHAPD